MNKGAVISECGQYRYQLWRIWNEDKPLVLFICLNPSKADANIDDPTLRRLMGFAYEWGYGGFYLGNLFAFRTAYPFELGRKTDPIGPGNDDHLEHMAGKVQTIVFAWGNDGVMDGRNAIVSNRFNEAMCFGLTKSGQPKHPLYLSKQTELISFI